VPFHEPSAIVLTATRIKTRARELGFDLCGIAPAADLPELRFLREWLDRGYGGTMTYLNRSARRRADVRSVMPSARTVIVTATNYNTGRPYSTETADRWRAQIAQYAWGDDYHNVIGDRLERLLGWMREQSSEPFEARAYVDTGPVQERVYAQHAGIGWIGKNTCVINPQVGSWTFLAAIICSLPLECDAPALDQCGACALCIEACPTQAIVAGVDQSGTSSPAVLDATKCISYLTIEFKADIDAADRSGIGSHVYGCDVCQEVCPWNATAPVSSDPAWQPRAAWDRVDLLTLARRTDDELAEALRGSAMQRAEARGLRRNVQIAIANAEKADQADGRRSEFDSGSSNPAGRP
jgi:epoxyqueuosine reductase